jgi:hypothetical protein
MEPTFALMARNGDWLALFAPAMIDCRSLPRWEADKKEREEQRKAKRAEESQKK